MPLTRAHTALALPSLLGTATVLAALAAPAWWPQLRAHYVHPPRACPAALPHTPAALWGALLACYQPFALFLAFYSAMTLCYWASGLAFAFAESRRWAWLDARKIHAAYNTRADYVRCLENLALNYSLVILPALVPGWPVLVALLPMDVASFPTLATFVWHLWLCWLGEDVMQYFFHRLLHVPWLYKRVHKLHHEYQVPFALSGSYAHPVEVVFLAICTFVPALLLRPHMSTFLAWIWLRQMDAVLEHCGYDLPNPLHALPFYGGVLFHDYHHTGFTTNFASRFTYLDRLLGTYRDPPENYGKVTLRKTPARD